MNIYRQVLMLFCAVSTPALADEYFQDEHAYKTSDLAKDLFGVPLPQNSYAGVDFGTIEANVSTKMDCGRIDLVTDFESQFKKLREQAKAFVQNLDGYVAAAPMLSVCCAPCRRNVLELSL